jgi:hypothetical protein
MNQTSSRVNETQLWFVTPTGLNKKKKKKNRLSG